MFGGGESIGLFANNIVWVELIILEKKNFIISGLTNPNTQVDIF